MAENTAIKELEAVLHRIEEMMDNGEYTVALGCADTTRNNLAQHTLYIYLAEDESLVRWEQWEHSPPLALLIYGLLFAGGYRSISEVTYRGVGRTYDTPRSAIYTFFVQGGPPD